MSLPLGETPSTTAGETPANPPATPAAAASNEMFDGQPFDAERARRLIETQRESERRLADSERALKAKLKELEPLAAKARELEDANRTELEKAQAKATELQQQLAAAQTAHRSALISAAVTAEATAQGANPDAVKRGTIARLVDTSTVEVAEDGTVTGADKAVKALLEAEPYLKAGTAVTAAVPATPRQNGVASDADAEGARQAQGAWLRGRI